ncbi:MAG: hypothetical protein HY051_01815 [Candidatus Aenigmarchaeota archaeon]|nr:hypothetical protein [Candidatus Aenigmarchaeota archaeon]
MNSMPQQSLLELPFAARQLIDVTQFLPSQLPSGKQILWKDAVEGRIEIYQPCERENPLEVESEPRTNEFKYIKI